MVKERRDAEYTQRWSESLRDFATLRRTVETHGWSQRHNQQRVQGWVSWICLCDQLAARSFGIGSCSHLLMPNELLTML